MGLRNASPVSFSPVTVTDALDGTNGPPGSMSSLSNLVPDPTTTNLFTCRPASEMLTDFPGFSDPGFISVYHVSGNLVYGMIATSLVPGYDQPFCYDAGNDTFITVTGTQDATTLPLSPVTSGEWTPPIMDTIGVLLVVTHPGFPGGVGAYFGWFDLTNPAVPVWNAGNTAVNALPFVPVSVAQFNGRAWYACGNSVIFSDVLVATTVTNADQVLTLGNNEDVTALAGMPLATMVSGGVLQCLIAFKGVSTMYQITGDATSTDLAVNENTVHTGTLAPNTITQTPKGLAFVSPEGLRIMDFQLQISDPIGMAGTGVSIPFIYTAEPSRMCAAYNANVIRISTENGVAVQNTQQEWWFDLARKIWTGPHTFPASYIHAFTHTGSGASHPSFILAPQDIEGQLWDSHLIPGLVPSFIENGDQMEFSYLTSMLPDSGQMSEMYLTETTIKMSLPPEVRPVRVTAYDENQVVLQSVTITSTGTPSIWGVMVWGVGLWGGAPDKYRPRRIPWEEQPTFRMLQIGLAGTSGVDFHVGTLQLRYQAAGYLQQEEL